MSGILGSFSGSMSDLPCDGSSGASEVGGRDADRASEVAGGAQREHGGTEEVPAVPAAGRPLGDGALDIADEILGRRSVGSSERLMLRSGDATYPLDERAVVIGRRDDPDGVVIADGRVSRRHALISPAAGGATIRDLGSSNGTVLRRDGITVAVGSDPLELAAGDVITTVDDLVLGTIEPAGDPQ